MATPLVSLCHRKVEVLGHYYYCWTGRHQKRELVSWVRIFKLWNVCRNILHFGHNQITVTKTRYDSKVKYIWYKAPEKVFFFLQKVLFCYFFFLKIAVWGLHLENLENRSRPGKPGKRGVLAKTWKTLTSPWKSWRALTEKACEKKKIQLKQEVPDFVCLFG